MVSTTQDDWAMCMGTRVRSLCRFVAQARTKSPGAPWMADFKKLVEAKGGSVLAGDEANDDDDDDEDDQKAAAEEPLGFDTASSQPFVWLRARSSGECCRSAAMTRVKLLQRFSRMETRSALQR